MADDGNDITNDGNYRAMMAMTSLPSATENAA